jgi:hypothetical protein
MYHARQAQQASAFANNALNPMKEQMEFIKTDVMNNYPPSDLIKKLSEKDVVEAIRAVQSRRPGLHPRAVLELALQVAVESNPKTATAAAKR